MEASFRSEHGRRAGAGAGAGRSSLPRGCTVSQSPFLFGGSYAAIGVDVWTTIPSLWVLPSLVTWFAYRHRMQARRFLVVIPALAAVALADRRRQVIENFAPTLAIVVLVFPLAFPGA